MNGMKAKAARRRKMERLTDEGLPRDARDWTEEDWRDLHLAIEEIKAKVRARHAKAKKCHYCKKRHAPADWCEPKQKAWRKSK